MFDKLGCLLHKRWISGAERTTIVGYWAEDGSIYEIQVPYQLRKSLVDMQNWLSDIWCQHEAAVRQMNDVLSFFRKY